MKRRLVTYKWLLTAWLLWGCIFSTAWAFDRTAQPALWSTTPTFSEDVRPTYQFHSTSAYTPTMHTTTFEPMAASPYSRANAPSRPRRSEGYWNEDGEWVPGDDELPIGVLPDPAPIGEPLILFALALLYFARLLIRRRG